MTDARNKPFESSAQNFEDVVLWRVLKEVDAGCYVDVGASDPVIDSISWSYYELGWHGVVIEPVPSLAAALRRRRPNDVTIEAAAGATRGTATLFVAGSPANSTLLGDVANRIASTGVEFSEVVARVEPLDDLLEDAGLDGRTIHFCTIDVEGSEADVLAGFDLSRWHPWILVIEATEPNSSRASHESWEARVLGAGYQFCLFDGLNRFYVHPDKADAFAEQLSYPACVLDDPFYRGVSAARRADELDRIASQATSRIGELEEIASRVQAIERESAALATRADEAAAELIAMKTTVSWRVTRPLRTVRGMHRGLVRRRETAARHPVGGRTSAAVDGDVELAFARRVVQATEALLSDKELGSHLNLEAALGGFEEALRSSTAPDLAKAWLSLVAVDGAFPGERTVEHIARMLRMEGASRVRREVRQRFANSVAQGRATIGELDVRRDRVIVDVTHTAMASDLHTGIQRVVRETVTRWIDTGRPMELVRFDLRAPAFRLLTSEERERFKSWRTHLGSVGTVPSPVRDSGSENTLVPWECDVVVPEMPFETERTEAYRGLATASVLRSLSMVGYDVIPMVAAEKVVPQMTTDFGGYLSVVKHADRVSTISRTSRNGFKAFATMAAAEGLRTPVFEALELPAEAPRFDSATVAAARSELRLGSGPVVLVVGSHEPRKNHLAVLEAAERLWARDNHSFELVFLGWSGWLSDEFDDLVYRLVSADRPIIVRKRCSEEQLWAAYRFARFTIFPSLLEGYGLPVAESLASGTPVITSNYGSMAEVADKGGCLLVNPRSVDELERAMALLLEDDDTLERLRGEASGADTGTWESYASKLWDFFTQEFPEAQFESAP